MADLKVPRIAARRVRRRSFSAASHGPSGMLPSAETALAAPSTETSGINSTKPNRRRSAVSSSAMERSAVFIVPITWTFGGTAKRSPESGRVTSNPRLSVSSSVSSSPKMRGMSPLLISSTSSRNFLDVWRASSQSLLKMPAQCSNTSCLSAFSCGRNPSRKSS